MKLAAPRNPKDGVAALLHHDELRAWTVRQLVRDLQPTEGCRHEQGPTAADRQPYSMLLSLPLFQERADSGWINREPPFSAAHSEVRHGRSLHIGGDYQGIEFPGVEDVDSVQCALRWSLLNWSRAQRGAHLGIGPDEGLLLVHSGHETVLVFGHGPGVGGTPPHLKRVPLAEAIVRELTGQAKEQAA